MAERLPTPEFSEVERELIAKLREVLPDDPKAHEMLVAWSKAEEERVEQEARAGDAARANIEFDLKKARLYHAAGYKGQAFETLNWVREQAGNIGADDLYDRAMAMMDEMDAEIEGG